jgi:hypothetical protein
MEEREYIKILIKQRELWTHEMREAMKKQDELSLVFEEKQARFYLLEEKYRDLFMEGLHVLYTEYPDLQNELPAYDTLSKGIEDIARAYIEKTGRFKRLAEAMKTVPQLIEASSMDVEIGKALFEYFAVFEEWNARINQDRERFFSKEYIARMDELADEGVMMYFLATPDFPLLEDYSNADFVLDSFIFNDYISTATLLQPLFEMSLPGASMLRKQEDLLAALNNMVEGCYRTAARTWFALLESEHKKCAEVMEGYWERARQFKNGFQRSKKIYELFDKAFGMEWERHIWEKVDAYYQKMVGKEVDGVVNRNMLIHGDYNNDSMDITDRDVVKIMLMWLDMRWIADHFCHLQVFIENRMSLVPYLCSLYPET